MFPAVGGGALGDEKSGEGQKVLVDVGGSQPRGGDKK